MATFSRQPFAPLDSSRLQTLTNIKNRQNSLVSTPPSASKRKASDLADGDDFENVDPIIYTKRAKASPSAAFITPSKDKSRDAAFKPTAFFVKPSPVLATPRSLPAFTPSPLERVRSGLHSKTTPITKSSATFKSSPLCSSAGRSPTRGFKRTALGNTYRRTASSLSRVNSPYTRSLGSVKAAPFSLTAALKGTIPGFSGLAKSTIPISAPVVSISDNLTGLYKREIKASWDFAIYEDTPQEHATNMLQHSTCTLDLSSDEENETRARKDRAEGRDKENVPPADDVSQTSMSRPASCSSENAMAVEQKRSALSDLNAADFWAEGCDESSVFIIPADEEIEADIKQDPAAEEELAETPSKLAVANVLYNITVDDILGGGAESRKASLLEPNADSAEAFAIWDSEGDKDESGAIDIDN